MHAFRKGKKVEKSNFRKFRRPILSQHGPQEGSQEASKIDQKIVKIGFLSDSLLGGLRDPKSLQKWFQNCPKSSHIGSKFLCFSLVASSIFHYTFSRFSEIERASRSFAKTGLSFCCFLALFFKAGSRTAFWPQKIQFFKLKSDFDLLLEASWDPLGTILGDIWRNFGNFLATCLASRFGIDF